MDNPPDEPPPTTAEGRSTTPASPIPLTYAQAPERIMIEEIVIEPAAGLLPGAQFFAGIAAGFAVSIVAWGIAYTVTLSGGNTSGNLWVVLAVAVLGLKMVAGVAALCLPGWRMAGGGLLTSIALGLLICGYSLFAAVCGVGK